MLRQSNSFGSKKLVGANQTPGTELKTELTTEDWATLSQPAVIIIKYYLQQHPAAERRD